jgi:hypothetical protein
VALGEQFLYTIIILHEFLLLTTAYGRKNPGISLNEGTRYLNHTRTRHVFDTIWYLVIVDNKIIGEVSMGIKIANLRNGLRPHLMPAKCI